MEIFGGNIPAAVQYLLAFVIILALLAGLAAILRRISAGASRIRFSATSARHRQQRLGVIDAVDIDAHRQLLLLRRDNVEHLVMIGGPNDLLVESGIGRQPYRAMVPAPSQQHTSPEAFPQQTAPVAAAVHAVDKYPVNGPVAKGSAYKDPALVAKTAENEKPEVVAPAEEKTLPKTPSKAPFMPGPIIPRPTAGQRSMATPVSPAMPSPTATRGGSSMSVPVPPAQPAKAAPQVASEMREPTEAVPPSSGMARHLEEALKRPYGAVRPAPVTGIKLEEPVLSSADVPLKTESEGAPASFVAPAPVAPIVPPRQVPAPALLAERPPASQPRTKEAPTVSHGTVVQEAVVQEVMVQEAMVKEEANASLAPAAPVPDKSKSSAFDLSSLENIEAEFARLLGRKPPADD